MTDTATCRLIQWTRSKPVTDKDGNPVCPKCGKPAEMILGFFGNPCWAHKVEDEAAQPVK